MMYSLEKVSQIKVSPTMGRTDTDGVPEVSLRFFAIVEQCPQVIVGTSMVRVKSEIKNLI